VPFFLSTLERTRTLTIGVLETAGNVVNETTHFDVVIRTPPQPRNDDPCAELRKRSTPAQGSPRQ